jgi:hypothetical protein
MTRGATTKNANNDKKVKGSHLNAEQRGRKRARSDDSEGEDAVQQQGLSQELCLGSMKGILICKTIVVGEAVQEKMEAEVPVQVRRFRSRQRDSKLKMAEELCSALDDESRASKRKHSSKCQAWPSSDIVFYQKHWTHLSAPGGSCKGTTRSWRR